MRISATATRKHARQLLLLAVAAVGARTLTRGTGSPVAEDGELWELRRNVDQIAAGHRAIIAELGRVRMVERDRGAALTELVGCVQALAEDHRRLRAEVERMRGIDRMRAEELSALRGELDQLATQVEGLRTDGIDPESLAALRSINERLRGVTQRC